MNYATLIGEELGVLQALEKQQTQAQRRDYVRYLRLLKSGQATSQRQAADQLNLSLRQGQRLWRRYRQDGLDALHRPRQATYLGKLSTTQISRLRQFLRDDQAYSLADIQAYLAGSLGITYTIGGVSDLCKRLKIKLKTGRPTHAHQRPGAVEEFKKTSPN